MLNQEVLVHRNNCLQERTCDCAQHNCSTQYITQQFRRIIFPIILNTIITAQTLSEE